MSAHDDPRYIADAVRVCQKNGWLDPRMPYAVNAHWRCETGAADAYPPTRNNPGNISRGAANDVHATYTIPDAATNPQLGNPIVTFADPHYGADVYGTVLGTLPRYAAVRAAGVAGDPHDFFLAIAQSGYHGTSDSNTTCMDSSYIDPISGAPASIGAPPSGTTGWVEATGLARIWYSDSKGILRPIPYAPGYRFEAWVGPRRTRNWAPGPKSTTISTAVFRQILSGSHSGKWIRVSDANTVWHEQ